MLKIIKRTFLGLIAVLAFLALTILAWWNFGDWKSRANEDIAFIHATIEAHHPGAVDPENPQFVELMDQALQNGMAVAEEANSSAGHKAALDAYLETFQDGHLTVLRADQILAWAGRAAAASAAGEQREPNIEQSGASYWITIPSFTEDFVDIRGLTEEIEARAEELQSADQIVFDLRRNGGGNSHFANRIAVALWSRETYLDWVPASANAIDWRATQENADHVYEIAQRYSDAGDEGPARSWQSIADGINEQALSGEPYYRQMISTREVTGTADSPMTAQVVALTDSRCASACLDFMDNLAALPGTVHIGAETSSDTQYIDVRRVNLPSWTGQLVIPLKVYRDRIRPSRGTYIPDVEIDPEAADWSAVREAVASI